MPRINIYINDQLKSRMDPFADDVNWSPICAAAIDRAIDGIEANQLRVSNPMKRRPYKTGRKAAETISERMLRGKQEERRGRRAGVGVGYGVVYRFKETRPLV